MHGNHANLHSNHANWFASFKIMMSIRHVSHLVRHMSHLFQLGETCVSPFSIPGSNTVATKLVEYSHNIYVLLGKKIQSTEYLPT